jgi:preprotein translocase subunit SecG
VFTLVPDTSEKSDSMLDAVITGILVLSALTLIFLILLHSGRGGGLSDMFGGGQLGGSMAGSTVVERNLDRLTVITGAIFILSTVLLALRVD